MITLRYQDDLDCYNIFSLSFLIPFLWRVSHIIQLILGYLDPTLVDHLSPYLSAHPIRHPFQPSVNCGSQDNTVQRSSLHKCGQKSSCNAFNAVTAALSQIFPSSHSSSMFVTHTPNKGISWKVTLSDRICIRSVLGLSEEIFLLKTPSSTFPLVCYLGDFELNTLTTVYLSSD